MFCSKCGTKSKNEDNFCSQCGTALTLEIATTIETSVRNLNNGQPRKEGTVYIVLGWIFIAISLLFFPILFGPGSVIMGYMVRKSGRIRHGTIIMILGVVAAILGMIIGALVALSKI